MKFILLICLLLTLFGCIDYGSYRYGGAFANVQLPVTERTIAVLDPRGAFGDQRARGFTLRRLRKRFGACPETRLLTEDDLNATGHLPAIYGNELSDSNLDWFVNNTEVDYLILIDVGPGDFAKGPLAPPAIVADREASTLLTVYALTDGGVLKTLAVTGSLNERPNRRIWEFDADEAAIGFRSLRKALQCLNKYSGCR